MILKLRNVYPYGLNDRPGDECKKGNTNALAGNKFPVLFRKYNKISCRASHKSIYSLSPEKFIIKLKHDHNHNLSGFPNCSIVSLLEMNKYDLKNS